MFLAPRQRKTTVFTRFWASASKNHGIYSVLWPGPSKKHWYLRSFLHVVRSFFWMPKAQKHCKLHDFYEWAVPKNYEKLTKHRPKNAQQGPPKRICKFYSLFFPTPNPQKRENPSRLKDFRGGSAAGARPRVAKAMLSCHHYTARHRRI